MTRYWLGLILMAVAMGFYSDVNEWLGWWGGLGFGVLAGMVYGIIHLPVFRKLQKYDRARVRIIQKWRGAKEIVTYTRDPLFYDKGIYYGYDTAVHILASELGKK